MEIERLISSIKRKIINIAVVGDIMLDEYFYGDVHRISPEFPVPVLLSPAKNSEFCPGGAGNVALQFKNFNTNVHLIGFIDEDYIYKLPPSYYSIGCIHISPCKGNIPKKIRFYNHDFPLLRWDIENPNYGLSDRDLRNYRELLFYNFTKLDNIDAVILSNYEKGVFDDDLAQSIIRICKEKNILTIVDPKNKPERWKGCDVYKPNSKEAHNMTGYSDWKKQSDELMARTDCQSVIITQAGNGVNIKYKDEHHEYKSYKTHKEVSSVIGAGDAFSAVLAVAMSHGFDVVEAAKLAFHAGTEYVKAIHNKPITLYELHKSVDSIRSKIITLEDMVELKKGTPGNRWIFTNGCFDFGLTKAHVEYLSYAKSIGDKLIVGINSDESVRKLKGEGRPIVKLEERMNIVAALESVDFVIPFGEETPLELIRKILPSAIVKGGDYKPEEVVGYGIAEVIIADKIDSMSTTEKIKLR